MPIFPTVLKGFVFLAAIVTTTPALAENVRLERLNIMFEGNESAEVYMRHCHNGGKDTAATFLHNRDLTAGYLAREMIKAYPQLSPDQAIESLSRRQSELSLPLEQFYKTNGCSTPQAAAARKHFDMFNAKPEAEMVEFLENIEEK